MLSKNEIKYIQSLGHKKSREELGLFVAEGPRLAEELISSNYGIQCIYALPGWIAAHGNHPFTVKEITEAELERISGLQSPNQVVVVAKTQVPAAEPHLQGKLTLVLDGIQDPGNLGTIIRNADWFGVQQIVCSPDTADYYNPKVVQASMGSICRVNVWYTPLPEWLPTATVPVWGAMLQGQPVQQAGPLVEGIIVIGNEGRGIRSEVATFINHRLTIPKKGGAESLNAAVATGIILSHIV